MGGRRKIPRWRLVVVLQLWLLLAAAGYAASVGEVAVMVFSLVAFGLGLTAAALVADREDHASLGGLR